MISKEEYIRLYCDDSLYEATGVIAISAEKFAQRLMSDPLKTIQDLDDYGFSDAMSHNDITRVSALSPGLGRIAHFPVNSSLEDFDPELFDWGDEDSIK